MNIKDFNHLNGENISRLWIKPLLGDLKKALYNTSLAIFFPFYCFIPFWSINILLMAIHHCIKYKGYCNISVGALGFIGLFETLNVFFTLKENSNYDICVMRHIMVKKNHMPSYIDIFYNMFACTGHLCMKCPIRHPRLVLWKSLIAVHFLSHCLPFVFW